MQNPKNDENLPNSTIFKIFRNSSRTRTETPQERAAGAQHLRSLDRLSCNQGQTLASKTKTLRIFGGHSVAPISPRNRHHATKPT